MIAAEPDQLHVREAEADGVDADQELTRGRPRYIDPLGATVASDVLDPFSVDVPRERSARDLRRRAPIPAVGLVHLVHFGRGRSAALSTRPRGSRMPTLVPSVSGLAVKRSPELIATQR